jgi:phosphodiesterase/alkaline phosphatase D-like protein
MNEQRPATGQIHIPHWILHAAHLLATSLALLVVILLALDQRFGWLRHSPGGSAFDLNEQPVFMAMFAIGALVALRWQLAGGALATFTAAALVVFASRQFRAVDATIVLGGFLLPGLLWVTVGLFELRDERFHRAPNEHPRPLLRRRDVIGGVALLGLTGIGGARIGGWVFDRIYGPTHSASKTSAVIGSFTRWVWSGAVTGSGATVTTRLVDDEDEGLELHVSTSPTLSNPTVVSGRADDEGVARLRVDGLEPATKYHYAFVLNGVVDTNRIGLFRTHPVGPSSFGVAFGSCSRTGSNGAVWDTIRSLEPDLMVVLGDLHYADIVRDDQQAFRQILDHQLSRPAPSALFRSQQVAYVWDDHDWGGPDADTGSRDAAMATYRQFVPHYPLAGTASPIHQAFTIGRVRFLLTDARSARVPVDDDDPGAGSMLGADQKAWLQSEMLSARDSHGAIVWVNPVPWISSEPGGDDWAGFVDERAEIAEFIAANDIAQKLLMVSGDAHMVALDDGSNSDYSTSGGGGFPVLHAAALDRPGSAKGGPYSNGAFPGGGQFGHIAVEDDGARLTLTLTGRDWRNRTLVEHTYRI